MKINVNVDPQDIFTRIERVIARELLLGATVAETAKKFDCTESYIATYRDRVLNKMDALHPIEKKEPKGGGQ